MNSGLWFILSIATTIAAALSAYFYASGSGPYCLGLAVYCGIVAIKTAIYAVGAAE